MGQDDNSPSGLISCVVVNELFFTLGCSLREFGLDDPKISFSFNMSKLILRTFRNYN